MEPSPRIRVLCVDDHPLIREGIASTLHIENDMELVANAANGCEAITEFRKHRPDVTLMDLRMPEMDGIAATSKILEEFPKARIVMLTTYSGDVNASRALKSGARGYLLKGMLRTELIKTIRRVHAGHQYIPPEIAQEIAAHINADHLTSRELDVLRCISTGKSNKAVAAALSISEDTVKGHVRNVLSKLDANDRTHAVMIAMERGFF
jgi:DNA-binding NarL/FixJ family response regulator